ncbi:hypothetical protein C9374_012454 [Naegleria lovaniensis]|uniref:Uncharacterized protein n=1 Tax=Naegleria lovaniensis TaxID=51637 RepID=A0AA88H2T8_NAELO|nr:uncharacterized protein C9374_012454 [Naegleria lovaniensis]KAG2392202.1 hypothetical protein C9374_012454 [Naegleria lovaniensis]
MPFNKKSKKHVLRKTCVASVHPEANIRLKEEPDQVYGIVVNVIKPRSVMECQYDIDYGTSKTLKCVFRGHVRKPIYFQVGEVLLLHLRDGVESNTADVLHRYKEEEIEVLKQMKQLPLLQGYALNFHRTMLAQLERQEFSKFIDLTFLFTSDDEISGIIITHI